MKRTKNSIPANNSLEVITENLKTHPRCPHGPTLLFARKIQGLERRFFACAACRDRKLCNFFLWADEVEKTSKHKLDAWKNERKKMLAGINHRKLFLLLCKVKAQASHKRIYCQKCFTFVLENGNIHENHPLLTNISDWQLEHPSEVLTPLENPKKEAQYLFAKSSIKVIVDIFQNLQFTNVICIGTPRIHEYIQYECKNMSSILLDIDQRFHSFFGPLQFCWYNSFNNHFFFDEAKQVFIEFLKFTEGKNTVLVTDPPFGGRIEPLVETFNLINLQYKKVNNGHNDLPVFWIFPYFMEPQVLNHLPHYSMLDYKVDYENHPLFQNSATGRKQGSPVRIFTNVSPSSIKLPEDYYKFCKFCNKYVSNENRHCKFCKSCTSKNGETYTHCNVCQRCVKPNWTHCKKCNRCAQREHKCELIHFIGACLLCSKSGHKKIDCPTNTKGLGLKRKGKTKKSKSKKLKS